MLERDILKNNIRLANKLELELKQYIHREIISGIKNKQYILMACIEIIDKYFEKYKMYDYASFNQKEYKADWIYNCKVWINTELKNREKILLILTSVVINLLAVKQDNASIILFKQKLDKALLNIYSNFVKPIANQERITNNDIINLIKIAKSENTNNIETQAQELKKLSIEMPKVLPTTSIVNFETLEKRRPLNLNVKMEWDLAYHYQLEMIDRTLKSGVKYVWTSAHEDSSERCKPWQSKLMSLTDGAIDKTMWTGEIKDGYKVYSYKDITNKIDKYGYKNNIIVGFNCRHYLIPYVKGSKPPKMAKSHETSTQRLMRSKRGAMERHIRQLNLAYKFYPEESIKNDLNEAISEYFKFCKSMAIGSYPFKYKL